MRQISFTVFGKPQPQQQDRTVPVMHKTEDGHKEPVMRTLPNGNRVPLMIHPNPKETVNWRSDAKSAALAAMAAVDGELIEGPLRMDIAIYLERPKYLCTPKELNRNAGARWAPRTPDRSNIMKSLEDALQGICYSNDAQLVAGETVKFYAPAKGYGDIRPRVEVTIEEIEDYAIQDAPVEEKELLGL